MKTDTIIASILLFFFGLLISVFVLPLGLVFIVLAVILFIYGLTASSPKPPVMVNPNPKVQFTSTVDKTELFLGDELKGVVRIKSDEELDFEQIWAELKCVESVKKTERYQDIVNDDGGQPVAVWRENDYWDKAKLYSKYLKISDSLHLGVGFYKEFPYVFKLPAIGRETYHSVDHYVIWRVNEYAKIKGYDKPLRCGDEISIAKPNPLVKEVVKEVVLMPCAYCGGLMPQSATFCPNCGAKRKA